MRKNKMGPSKRTAAAVGAGAGAAAAAAAATTAVRQHDNMKYAAQTSNEMGALDGLHVFVLIDKAVYRFPFQEIF